MKKRALGLDIGTETIKIVDILIFNDEVIVQNKICVEHFKKPIEKLNQVLDEFLLKDIDYICSTGRHSHLLPYTQIPENEARAKGFKHLFPEIKEASIISIGSQGYSLLELHNNSKEIFRQNPRCSEGAGNFLHQLTYRFGLSLDESDILCEKINDPLTISGRCPVIKKTSLTHLANNGENKLRIIAGLFDSLADDAIGLLKYEKSPRQVYLTGGVSRSKRLRNYTQDYLQRNNMNLINEDNDNFLFIESLGCSLSAIENNFKFTSASNFQINTEYVSFEKKPPLSCYISSVNRLQSSLKSEISIDSKDIILGFDIGSTGSKLVGYDFIKCTIIFYDYINTNGDPIHSTKKLIENFVNRCSENIKVTAFGVTGSGRDIAGSILSGCFGSNRVFSRNEIVAHAQGALYYDKNVDTIFEIGGQDSKYIRLQEGNIIDVALNETCSAGTGSFIEEQGRRFEGISDIQQLSEMAMTANNTVDLGRHCSVFMANLIDQAISNGNENDEIIAGIFNSVVQNYTQRVIGNRKIGDHIFCQGMPFLSDALAAAVVRQTGKSIIIPPNPGNVGALGIAILASKNLQITGVMPVAINQLNEYKNIVKGSFICNSNNGCDKPGNLCRIETIRLFNNGNSKVINWGGICSLWIEKDTAKEKLPDFAPDPFKLREQFIDKFEKNLKFDNRRKSIALTNKFQLKELFPFFATFFNELGFNVVTEDISTKEALKKGINNSDVLFCSPMMIYNGITKEFFESKTDYIFLPILIDSPKIGNENYSKLCPIVQGSTDIISKSLKIQNQDRIISPIIEIGNGNLKSIEFLRSCKKLANLLGYNNNSWKKAFTRALKSQTDFLEYRLKIGFEAIHFCENNNITPIVIIGRSYSVYNNMLNSGVPRILQSLGFMPIPLDCFYLDNNTDDFKNIYWNCGQEVMMATKKISTTSGLYAIFCSNYSCGPDSFLQHFFQDVMNSKPHMIIENDIRSGDSGIKTRLEAFLDCIKYYTKEDKSPPKLYNKINYQPFKISIDAIIKDKTKFLVPYLGPVSEIFAACLRGSGINAEALPITDKLAIEKGRQYTTGKECSPMNATLGSLLLYFSKQTNNNDSYLYFMPGSDGPCRFGMYNILHKIIIENLGLQDRIKVLSSGNDNFIAGVPKGLFIMVYIAICIIDYMNTALHYTRPVEKEKGKSDIIFNIYKNRLIEHLESISGYKITFRNIIYEIVSGKLFGCTEILEMAVREFQSNKLNRSIPTVSIDGALYIRCDSFSSDFISNKLENKDIRTIPAPFFDWLEFLDYSEDIKRPFSLPSIINKLLKHKIKSTTNAILNNILGCPKLPHISEEIKAIKPYMNFKLISESMLSVGSSIALKRKGEIDALIVVSPHECLQSKIVDALLQNISEKENLYSKSIQFNGEKLDREIIDSFAFDVKKIFYQKK